MAAITLSSCPMCLTAYQSPRAVKTSTNRSRRRDDVKVIGNWSHFRDAVSKDMEFLKKGIEWTSNKLQLPQVSKTLNDIVWLRNLEDPEASPLPPSHWPEPSYPGLTGVDLLMADLKALETYASYFYYRSKVWSKPLPEVYNPEDVTDYFSCRPHVVALRVLEVGSCFISAAIKIRMAGMRKFLKVDSEKNSDDGSTQYNLGMVLKETMLNLGPTFIKVGQSLSTRPDIIGSDISKALSGLHDQIPPFPRSIAMKIIEEELGSSVESYFSYISEEPVAAASFGQVYRGSTPDGLSVAVKVQRPNLRHVVVRDIYILRLGLGLLQKIAKRKGDLRLYADELGKGLVGELDYTLEAANASEFQEVHSRFTFIRVPKVFHHLSRKRVLTMEWMVGESPTSLYSVSTGSSADHRSTNLERQKSEAKNILLDLVNKGVEATLIQLLETGLLHADPHPGNLRYLPSGQLGFLDFGLLCRMERKHQFAMLASIVHIVNGDWSSLVQALCEMDVVRPGTNIRRVTMELEDALGEVEFNGGIPDVKFSRVLGKIWSVALKYHFRMPPYYTLVLRSLASFEGLALAADPNFKTFEAAYPYVVRKLLTENSADTRKILHSVVLNNRKEFRWQRIALFLRVGATRKALQQVASGKNETSPDYVPNETNEVISVANLVWRLLPSKEGGVLRRLLMTADGASLVQALVSKEGSLYRKQTCAIIADALYQLMFEGYRSSQTVTKHNSQVRITAVGPDNRDLGTSSRLSTPDYSYLFRDRRLRVIFAKILEPVRRQPVLLVKLCWTACVMFVTAFLLACHRQLVSSSKSFLASISLSPKRYAIGASSS